MPGLVHQQDFGSDSKRPGNAQPLLLPARQGERGIVQPIFHFIPEGGRLQAGLDLFLEIAPAAEHPVDAQPVGDVLEDRLGKGFDFWNTMPTRRRS